jgi:hypothetical protein
MVRARRNPRSSRPAASNGRGCWGIEGFRFQVLKKLECWSLKSATGGFSRAGEGEGEGEGNMWLPGLRGAIQAATRCSHVGCNIRRLQLL